MVVFNDHAQTFEEDRRTPVLLERPLGEAMIQITDHASTHIRRMLAKRNRGETALRLGVRAGGCSGFEYTFAWEAAPKPGDSTFEARMAPR